MGVDYIACVLPKRRTLLPTSAQLADLIARNGRRRRCARSSCSTTNTLVRVCEDVFGEPFEVINLFI